MRNVLMLHSSVGISWLFSSANYALAYTFSMNNGGSTKRNCSIKSYKNYAKCKI